jgi:hypothetical protein
MATTLAELEKALKSEFAKQSFTISASLSDAQYSDGFQVVSASPKDGIYADFVLPRLESILTSNSCSIEGLSILEIGPGPESVLTCLPHHLRKAVKKYTAYEPNHVFAEKLKTSLDLSSCRENLFPSLKSAAVVHEFKFHPEVKRTNDVLQSEDTSFDIILFCHSLYGLKPQSEYIKKAISMLSDRSKDSLVVVFHREGVLELGDLVCHQVVNHPLGMVSVTDRDDALDNFAQFIAGCKAPDVNENHDVCTAWRQICREHGLRNQAHPDVIMFSSPDALFTFNRGALALPELLDVVPQAPSDYVVKNREARVYRPAAIVRPTSITHVQECVRWALRHKLSLTVIGGGHSGQCLRPNVVAVNMSAFKEIYIWRDQTSTPNELVVAGAGCTSGDIIGYTLAAGLTVPLGSRPSVGAGLWLQGGLGHLARLYGLSCDSIVGAVVVSVLSGEIWCIGHVPNEFFPDAAVTPKDESSLLWATKGAGTNFGIVTSVVFKPCETPSYLIRNWILPVNDSSELKLRLQDFEDNVVNKLARDCSADAYLFWENDALQLGIAFCEIFKAGRTPLETTRVAQSIISVLGPEYKTQSVDSVGLFDTEMYMSQLHGGHGGGKTSSFKRCVFLQNISDKEVALRFAAAVQSRPFELCYLHLLHGGGATGDIPAEGTAFGCRDWNFACIITGVWPRGKDGGKLARRVMQWVYDVAYDLLPESNGAYGADLGPDPRDAVLAAHAFGPNAAKLSGLKLGMDPGNVLAFACPFHTEGGRIDMGGC